MRFKGKVIAITGAASGIGRESALRLASEGADIAALDLSEEGLSSLRSEIKNIGRRCETVTGSVAELGNIKAIVDRAIDTFGGLDGLINNAGVGGPMQRFDKVNSDDFDKMIAINLKPVWYGMQLVYATMRERGGGAILNVSSMAGIVPNRHHALYGMTKAAIISLTQHAAMDYAANNIRVNSLCPGPVKTTMFDQMREQIGQKAYEDAVQNLMQRTLLNRFGTTSEQAATVAFLLSDEAAFITGIAMPVDGGWSISDGHTR
ncbi:SDR family NAD(P)-dependent oxidoreductase [Kordiimonas sp.]|uniref:SDR family NAD(P)-dependent oxidoreductase n=1 Tax=Kordiimonas sp. TaxID=1970157 RepID=UPI003A8D1935